MFLPSIVARIEKTNNLTFQQCSEVAAFIAVADWARPSEIVRVGAPTVFQTDNMVNLKLKTCYSLGKQAVFAAVIRSFRHQLSDRFRNVTAHGSKA